MRGVGLPGAGGSDSLQLTESNALIGAGAGSPEPRPVIRKAPGFGLGPARWALLFQRHIVCGLCCPQRQGQHNPGPDTRPLPTDHLPGLIVPACSDRDCRGQVGYCLISHHHYSLSWPCCP